MTCPPCTNDCNQGRTCPARSGNEIIKMARQAGFFVKDDEAYSPSNQEDHELTPCLEVFAALVAAKEREKAWEEVNALIVFGDIGGNGTDPTAQRNGVILATNVLMERVVTIRERGQA